MGGSAGRPVQDLGAAERSNLPGVCGSWWQFCSLSARSSCWRRPALVQLLPRGQLIEKMSANHGSCTAATWHFRTRTPSWGGCHSLLWWVYEPVSLKSFAGSGSCAQIWLTTLAMESAFCVRWLLLPPLVRLRSVFGGVESFGSSCAQLNVLLRHDQADCHRTAGTHSAWRCWHSTVR
jgi:hypothetical protein